MHTSPKSTGVSSWPGTSAVSLVSIAFEPFGLVRVEDRCRRRPRDSSVLSTPHITSPSGLPAVNLAFVTIVPASPAMTIFTAMPVDLVNSSSASLSVVFSVGNES